MFDWRGVGRAVVACREALGALALPLACEVCGADGQDEPFCLACRAELLGVATSACPRCALPLGPWARSDAGCAECRGRPLGFDAAVALGPYQGPIRHLCLRLKHERDAWLAPWLADLLVEARGAAIRGQGAARVVPIPLHWKRYWARGYNQTEELAAGVARRLGLRLVRSLRRVVAVDRLAGMGSSERARAIRGAFRARPDPSLKGQTVLLVDDILTTGATCGEAARTLKRAGAARVVAVVVARAEGRS